jgi:gamma-glutamylcyclotransferase (GGCT)/AIG2-like uncharacterized protein YtfP
MNNYLFVYGILKRGYELDLEDDNRGQFLGEATLDRANLYRIGDGVGLRFVKDPNRVAQGEVFRIHSQSVWRWLDSIEQNGRVYTRKIVTVHMENARSACGGVHHEEGKGCADCRKAEELLLEPVEAWVYEHTYPGMQYSDYNLIEGGEF